MHFYLRQTCTDFGVHIGFLVYKTPAQKRGVAPEKAFIFVLTPKIDALPLILTAQRGAGSWLSWRTMGSFPGCLGAWPESGI
jgi:hypothetical protein